MDVGDRRDAIDRTALTYLYEQVAEDLRELIATGELKAGDKLPSEPDLATAYGVSRVTIRSAVRELVDTGWLKVLRGRGTLVTPSSGRRRT